MKKKKIYINNKKERAILSDVLPYELPITFSNRYFYEFLIDNNIELNGNKLTWKSDKGAVKSIIKLLFNLDKDNIENERKNEINIKSKGFRTIPFGFKITHKESSFRELTIIHPKNQISLVDLYDKYKQSILYYCNIGSYSIRRPHAIARYTYYKDRTHFKNYAHDHEHKTIEEFDKEYENLKTYFSYREISNIYKFYESYKYHRCEKKYNYLFKFDILKCFDSIYTHSISWALLSKDVVKDGLAEGRRSFGDSFDRFMQNLNYSETNGIVIGPEFSRIFAEIILQKIDFTVRCILKTKYPSHENKHDYEIYRYVDDVFVFYNDEEVKNTILESYHLQLKEYKLNINELKTEIYVKPIITGISRAKLKISDLFNDKMCFNIEEKQREEGEDANAAKRYNLYVSSNKLITRFKTIIKEAGIEYKDILTYTLACLDKKLVKIIKNYLNNDDKVKYDKMVITGILELLDFTFFIYSISPKVNSTIKLSMILSKLIKFLRNKRNNINLDNQGLIFKKIYDEIFLVLKKYKNSEHAQIETLYLLIVLKELGREYRITERVLCRYYGIDIDNDKCRNDLNYFSITVLLFYIGDKVRYNKTKIILKDHIVKKIEKSNKRGKTTELVLLLFDLLSCPYLEDEYKNKLLDLFGVEKNARLRGEIISMRRYWFTKWTDFNFVNELEAKKGNEVY